MKIVDDLQNLPEPFHNAVVTIGNFDGVHKGHQALIREVKEQAHAIQGTAVAVTFEPHPARVLKKDAPLQHITMIEQKIELLEKLELDALVCIPFTESFARVSAREFVENILVEQLGMKAIVVGKDYAFGRNREGTIPLLKEMAGALGFEVTVMDWQYVDDCPGERVSSTRIRNIIMEGDVEKARKLLGRHYQIRGSVVSGRDRGGKLLGFPTANINLQDELCPKTGVYAVTVQTGAGTFQGVANIGFSPTFEDHLFTVEVHILDFNSDIYNQPIRVNFVSRLRDEMKFSNIQELSNQIKRDIEKARQLLSTP